MSEQRIEATNLWKRTLESNVENSEYNKEKEKLRSAFWDFRTNVMHLTSRIAACFPDLTQHDISHLDALWEVADLIIGKDFPMNPLEAFVLGGAILLHDSALCFEAYQGGKEAVRNTAQWKDAFALLQEQQPNKPQGGLEHSADFEAIRYLHAAQAEKLAEFSWNASDGGRATYLLPDEKFRKHLGKLMGQIAASHHWAIEKVASEFEIQINALAEFPKEWTIDPLKIACILRCADAAHFDNERAPDFLFALLKRNQISLLHWKAQNRISPVNYDNQDTFALCYTSTINFPEEDAGAWYVAYDALCLVHKEIQASNALLEHRAGCGMFQAKGVKGVESPETMTQYIKPQGWKPCTAKVHISNVEDMIRKLGGEQLYGADSDKLEIVIRELIQNARDAVAARKHFDKNFDGKILVSIAKDPQDSSLWLVVEDNGIGMSERVLTDVLLDFGTSFWASNLVQSEFPGLRSSSFRSVGKFGIGFFSAFMIAEQVFVESRNWKAGLVDIHQLKFMNGLSLKPIICKGEPPEFNSSFSTRINLKLKPTLLSDNLEVEIKVNYMGAKNFTVPIQKYIAAICAGIDIPVFFRQLRMPEEKIHESITAANFNTIQWLRDISFADYQDRANLILDYIGQHHQRMKPIIESGQILGLAAISTFQGENYFSDFLGLYTVGGLANGVHSTNRHNSSHIMGYLDHKPQSARREMSGNTVASNQAVQKWAGEQLDELLTLNLDPVSRYCAASNLSNFDIDSTPLAIIFYMRGDQMFQGSISDLADLSLETGLAFCFSEYIPNLLSEPLRIVSSALYEYARVQPLSNGQFISLERTVEEVPVNNFSMLDCIYRMAQSKGYSVSFEVQNNIGSDRFGGSSSALILKSARQE